MRRVFGSSLGQAACRHGREIKTSHGDLTANVAPNLLRWRGLPTDPAVGAHDQEISPHTFITYRAAGVFLNHLEAEMRRMIAGILADWRETSSTRALRRLAWSSITCLAVSASPKAT